MEGLRFRIATSVCACAIACLASTARAAPVAYYRFEERPAGSVATTINDSSGNGLNATAANLPAYGANVPTPSVPLTGAANHTALTFDGTPSGSSSPTTPRSP